MSKTTISAIPKRILDRFLERLEEEGQPTEIIGRLRDVLFKEADPTEAAIRAAIFPIDEHS